MENSNEEEAKKMIKQEKNVYHEEKNEKVDRHEKVEEDKQKTGSEIRQIAISIKDNLNKL